jgi:hypothetical protein
MKAKFNQETRDFIEGVFKNNNYSVEKQIQYLEIRERQKYNYYLDKSNGNWSWSQEDEDRFQSEWDEIIEMLKERREA